MNKNLKHCFFILTITTSPLVAFSDNGAGSPPVSGTAKENRSATQTATVHSTDLKNPGKCTAHNKDYGSMHEGMWDKGPSIMSECGIGRLVDFDILKIFDPIGALLDAMQGAICGWVNDAMDSPFVQSYNKAVTGANEWTSDVNRGYDDWVSDRQAAIYHELYAKYKRQRESGLDDIGYPYDTVFSDPEDYPPGYIPPSTGNQGGGGNSGSGNSVDGGSLDTSLNDGDIIIIGNESPIIIDNKPQPQIKGNKAKENRGPEPNYSEIYDIFNK